MLYRPSAPQHPKNVREPSPARNFRLEANPMLSLYQRLVIGCLLLVAIVLGMTFYVRSSLRNMAASDAIIVAHATSGRAEAQRVADEEVTWGNHLLTTIEVCALLALI